MQHLVIGIGLCFIFMFIGASLIWIVSHLDLGPTPNEVLFASGLVVIALSFLALIGCSSMLTWHLVFG